MLNYEVDQAVLRSHVPEGTVVDTWQGEAFVEHGGFSFPRYRTRLGRGDPVSSQLRRGQSALLRAAGRQGGRSACGGIRQGDRTAASHRLGDATCCMAKNTCTCRCNTNWNTAPAFPALSSIAGATRGRWQRLGVKPLGAAQPMAPGSEEEFIAEHSWICADQRSGTVEYAVEHPPWRVWQVGESWLECDVA